MTALDNPPENPCFGCGPEHARGLKLSFERIGDEVRCTYTPKPDEIGWPGIMHTGLHFTALFETCYWAALELTGQVYIASGEQTYVHQRLPRVGVPFTVRARILNASADPSGSSLAALAPVVSRGPLRVVAESATAEGKPLGKLTGGFSLASRAQTERAGIKLPEYLTEQMAP